MPVKNFLSKQAAFQHRRQLAQWEHQNLTRRWVAHKTCPAEIGTVTLDRYPAVGVDWPAPRLTRLGLFRLLKFCHTPCGPPGRLPNRSRTAASY